MFGCGSIESILEQNILVKGVVFRRCGLLRTRIIDRRGELGFRGYDLSDITLYCEVILVVGVEATGCESLVNGPEAIGLAVVGKVDRGDVAEH